MAEASSPLPPLQRAIVAAAVMGGMLLVVLDMTIANVALPHMRAALSATQDTVAWVLTAYIVASAIATPVTGWLADRFGRRELFTVAVIGFTVSSMLCGIAESLPMMVAARLLQGLFGAFMMPLSQAVMFDINPPEKHASAMTLFSIGVVLGPVLGPVIGGWLTDTWSWRWCFFVNVPVGVLAAITGWIMLPDTPRRRREFDVFGFTTLAVMLLAMQLALDRGTDRDWFDSIEIIAEAGIAIAAAWMLVIHLATARNAIIPPALFRNPTFAGGMVMITVIGAILTAGMALLAPMLQGLMGYSVTSAGALAMPRGIGVMIAMFIAGRLIGKADIRVLIGAGLVITAISLFMMTGFSPAMDSHLVITSGFVQGIGMGLVTMPLNLVTISCVGPALRTEAASMFALMRNLGGSFGISITTALLARNVQQSHSDLTGNLDASVRSVLDMGQIEKLGLPGAAPGAFLDGMINQQAAFIAYINDYWLMMIAVVATMPLVLIMRRPRAVPVDNAELDLGH